MEDTPPIAPQPAVYGEGIVEWAKHWTGCAAYFRGTIANDGGVCDCGLDAYIVASRVEAERVKAIHEGLDADTIFRAVTYYLDSQPGEFEGAYPGLLQRIGKRAVAMAVPSDAEVVPQAGPTFPMTEPNVEALRVGQLIHALYRERNAVVAALIRTNGWPQWVINAPDEPGWFIVYTETKQGQLSWHVGPADIDLFGGGVTVSDYAWDGHTTEEKYRRLAALKRWYPE